MRQLISKMTAREKTLATVVIGALVLFLNLSAISGFVNKQALLRSQTAAKKLQLQAAEELLKERQTWDARREWLQRVRPSLANEGTAGVELLNLVKQAGGSHNISLANLVISPVERNEFRASVFVSFETKSTWKDLIGFLHELQGPEKFIVLESVELEVDPSNAAEMRALLRVARWYAP